MLPPYLDQLDNARQTVLNKLRAFSATYVLGGGTAIMLQIGHRKSYDFDCFTENELSPALPPKAIRLFGKGTMKKTKIEDILTLITPEAVEVTFISYPYKSLQPPIQTPFLPLLHLDDLVANKAHTLGRRNAWRDYVDLFFFLKWKLYDLSKIITLSKTKYGGEFNGRLFLDQLTYYKDMDIVPTMFLKESYTPEEIKVFLGNQVDAYLKTVLPQT